MDPCALSLIAGTEDLIVAEMESPARFAALLGVPVPENWTWPGLRFGPEETRSKEDGWWSWYALADGPVLVGCIRFRHLAAAAGQVEIDCSVLPSYRGQGVASRMLAALLTWAFSQEKVQRVVARLSTNNPAGARLLRKNGFIPQGRGGFDEQVFACLRPQRRAA
jgi:[ribosomal protein S5]-alanine N-acetyltransferase